MRRLGFAVLLLPGCFSPSDQPDSDPETETSSGSSSDPTPTGSSGASTDTPSSSTTAGVTTDTPPPTTTTTTDGPSTDTETTDPDSSSTGPISLECGDGIVGDDEECDDGRDNALTGACRPNCTLAVCGDGNQAPDEACDEGNQNSLDLGACAPDCSTFIAAKSIVISDPIGPNSGPPISGSPVQAADAACPTGYRAMFAFGDERRATTAGYAVADPIDWPILPFTQYQNDEGDEVWTTDDEVLLGVRNSGPRSFEAPIDDVNCGVSCNRDPVVTGMNVDWTTATDDCLDWGSASDELTIVAANPDALEEFLAGDEIGCDEPRDFQVFCVEL